jgi:hypothetical protein
MIVLLLTNLVQSFYEMYHAAVTANGSSNIVITWNHNIKHTQVTFNRNIDWLIL